ncbi:MAG: hypothetical protein LQ343_000960 [Gyalolechia ehrenbergii]|nr:MAG: hypothetical protein LQ343_000960 [Gyalolechia ehrenbergii]
MASRNPDSMTNAQGEFQPHKPRDEPLTTHGHKPGVLVGNDTAPEFSAKTLPPGSAPADRTFKPNNISEVPGQADNPDVLRSHGKESTHTTASSTLGGATSGDVYQGLGKPMQGQSSSELHDRQSRGGGLAGVGASGAASGNQMADERMQPSQRGLEKEGADVAGKKVDQGAEGADELPNKSA